MRTSATGTPAHVQPSGTGIADYPLTSEEFARLNRVAVSTVRTRFSRTGSFHGLRPLKLASGRVRWPNVVVTSEIQSALRADQEARRHD